MSEVTLIRLDQNGEPTQISEADLFLRTASLADIKDWLRKGLESYFEAEGDIWAFHPLAGRVNSDINLAYALKTIYDEVSPDQRSAWRRAVTELIAETVPIRPSLPVIETLVELARLMPAFEVLETLPCLVGQQVTPDIESYVYELVTTTAVLLAAQTPAAVECLHKIATSLQLSPDFAGLVFIALCRAAPDQWPEHLNRLRSPLNKLVSEAKLPPVARTNHAREFLSAIGLERLVRSLNRLVLSNNGTAGDDTDEWLWRGLFVDQKHLLERDGQSIKLVHDPKIRAPIPEEIATALFARPPRRGRLPQLSDNRAQKIAANLEKSGFRFDLAA